MEKLLPAAMVVLSVCAAVGYIGDGDWRKVIYWLAAATLTTAVTW